MNQEEYDYIYSKLNKPGDVKALHEETDVAEEALFSILSQKTVYMTKKKHPFVKKNIEVYSRRWSYGQSFMHIAKRIRFSPVMTASMILRWDGMARKQINKYLAAPETAPTERLREELAAVVDHDFVFSPKSIENRYKLGKEYEKKLKTWLETKGANFISEEEARQRGYKKTPDVIIESNGLGSFLIDGRQIGWIDSKASFGSTHEIKYDYNTQLRHYVEAYGGGLVVYWFGYVDTVELQSIRILDNKSFENALTSHEL